MTQNKKNALKLFWCLLSLLAVAACVPNSSSSGGANSSSAALSDDLNPDDITNPIDIADAVPTCEVDIPQYQFDGNVNAFEATDSGGVTIGYNPGGTDSPVTGSVSLLISKADMDFSMIGTDPLAGTVEVSTDVSAGQTSTTINATIDFAEITATPNFFFQTPLATVSANALSSAVAAIKTQTDGVAWMGRVLKHLSGSQVLINGGTQNGLMVGDTFNVFDVTNYWSGTPCQSTYFGSTTNSNYPDANIQLTLVSTSVSIGVLTSSSESSNVVMGAEVVPTALSAAPAGTTRYLKKNVTLGTITAENFTLPGGGTFDFQGAMNSQIIDVLNQSGAYVFPAP